VTKSFYVYRWGRVVSNGISEMKIEYFGQEYTVTNYRIFLNADKRHYADVGDRVKFYFINENAAVIVDLERI